jgi:transposase
MSTARKLPSPANPQHDLFGPAPGRQERTRLNASDTGRRFIEGDAHQIVLGTMRLEDYLKHVGQRTPFVVADLLEQQDWGVFERRYAPTGRAAYAPRQMMGLILYGVMQGVHSLRELERLARLDLGCMWLTGGLAPDHANIGRFIVMHEQPLSEDFFESLTRSILKASGSQATRLAGDGTVIEAACSHYKLLKQEAVKAHVRDAEQAARQAPEDASAQQQLQQAQQCQQTLEVRQAAARRSSRDPQEVRISAQEPEAMVQRLKRGRGAGPSYKPSILANEDRIITAFAVDASNETRVIAPMLDQSRQVTGQPVQEVLLDAGYFHDEVIAATLERDVSLLCPEGNGFAKAESKAVFAKAVFAYDNQTDTYRCPAGEILILLRQSEASAQTREHRVYGGAACGDCALRAQCTKAAQGRLITRYPEDEAREALRAVMEHSQAKRIFRRRQAMVEPVFASLRCKQGFNRFRRKGLRAVQREWALHVLAHNLNRAVALSMKALLALLLALLGAHRRVVGCFSHACRFLRSPRGSGARWARRSSNSAAFGLGLAGVA